MRTIERSTEHYGDSAVVTADRLSAKDGAGYASVSALGEVQLLRVNRTRKSSDPLVAIYPFEGMLLREEPFYVLDAPWMEAEETAAANVLREFLERRSRPTWPCATTSVPATRREAAAAWVDGGASSGSTCAASGTSSRCPSPPS